MACLRGLRMRRICLMWVLSFEAVAGASRMVWCTLRANLPYSTDEFRENSIRVLMVKQRSHTHADSPRRDKLSPPHSGLFPRRTRLYRSDPKEYDRWR